MAVDGPILSPLDQPERDRQRLNSRAGDDDPWPSSLLFVISALALGQALQAAGGSLAPGAFGRLLVATVSCMGGIALQHRSDLAERWLSDRETLLRLAL